MSHDPDVRAELEALRQEVRAHHAQKSRWRGPVLGLAVVVAGVAVAQPVITPFIQDEPAQASQVNANFAQVSAWAVPRGAVLFFDGNTCPTGWSVYANGQGRLLMGRPATGTLGRAFGGALSADNEASHNHGGATAGGGNHSHTGITASFNSYSIPSTSEVNWNTTAGYQTPFFPRHNLSINAVGDHQHGLSAQNGSAVLPYVYLTPCRKD